MTIALVWFRQDLRLTENPAFIEACSHPFVIPLYIYDENHSVLGEAQAWWLHHSLIALNNSLNKEGLSLVLRKGNPLEIILDLIRKLPVESVYWNRCYEPLAITRDKKVKAALLEKGIKVHSSNGSLLHEPWTIRNENGDFFKVFTHYWKRCRQILDIQPSLALTNRPNGIKIQSDELQEWKLLSPLCWTARFPEFWTPGEEGAQKKLNEFIDSHLNGYKKNRDFPAKNATSRLSPHVHFGEISPWTILKAIEQAKQDPNCDLVSVEHFLSELGWREFSVYLLYHFPSLPYENFRKKFDVFPWQNNEEYLTLWQKGMTGYPIIDAGMRELRATGYMHNRVRMITASFLTKDLLIHWRLGADWFLNTLVDADLANNSASWQWVAGCGVDAAPYFRIFNPVLQSQTFDPDGAYIRQWLPELSSLKGHAVHAPWEGVDSSHLYFSKKYPKPIINHHAARIRALNYYKSLQRKKPL
ncbi:cryptochrome/photolyase family protein [Legionella oakridgensis]|uniref:Deoxyribodipyrimidine photo-lyase n=2 Tax=Legionella oakridgensis TaxID=29423 RepID=W0BIV3_9GAMM|nr:deoxyribodipyrimidine photo-lyase [Legionella oakridgensis]AHE68339.1 deoxyribodipyrimidine photolyase [Legionella oakridgensis ATCC 33761 = DSM 21215]ETO92201.1 deoxyribodipyrimidine photo-lyase type I [Legionella oakridgensis RV-2-2007]KTD38990.1 deoxyribodipyrimidine photolyase [Legionella oakridgensis]STY21282.1 deoxyribodipyrimidine photolyase [Legionella longbeachae]